MTRRAPDTPPRVLMYAPDNRHHARMSAKLAGFADVAWLDSRDIAPTLLVAQQTSWVMVLLDYSSANAQYSSELARQLLALMPELPLVAVGGAGSDQGAILLAAMRAGVRDFIDIESPAEDVQKNLQHVLAQRQAPRMPVAPEATAPQARGRLVVLLGSRPGVGVTTLAVQLGTSLRDPADAAEARPRRQLLLDLGQPSGDGALYLNLSPDFHCEDAQRNLSRLDATLARTAMTHHASGLAVLGQPGGAAPAMQDAAPLMNRLLGVFDLVVCDLGGLSPQQLPLALLRQANELWIMVDQSIGALVSLDLLAKELDAQQLRDERCWLLVNRYDDNHGLSSAQLAERFGLPLLATLPDRARALRACAAEGQLLSQQSPNDPYLRALAPLLLRLDPGHAPPPPATALQRLARHLGIRPWKTK
ncbi:AAA family ATPase [Stenotrophomonas panacihumi]|nr:hypothetical protein [Stenotrophomonas panacihumi]